MVLFNNEDVERWQVASDIMLEILMRKSEKRSLGDRFPQQLAMQYEDDALIAMAKGEASKALGYMSAVVRLERQLWSEFRAGHSRKDTVESIRQMGYSPIILAAIVSQQYALEVARDFVATYQQLEPDHLVSENITFGRFLLKLLGGNSCEEFHSTEIDADILAMANAVLSGDSLALRSAIVRGAENWLQYLKSDPGQPNSVAYFPGLAFLRIGQEPLPDLKVEHFLVDDSILCAEVDETVAAQ